MQNELMVLSTRVVRTKLIRELVDKRVFYAIMADETSDISDHEQLSISTRYVSSEPDENGEFIHEVFLGFIHLTNLTAIQVANKIRDFLNNISLSIDLIRGNILAEKFFLLDDKILHTIDQFHVLRCSRKGNNIIII